MGEPLGGGVDGEEVGDADTEEIEARLGDGEGGRRSDARGEGGLRVFGLDFIPLMIKDDTFYRDSKLIFFSIFFHFFHILFTFVYGNTSLAAGSCLLPCMHLLFLYLLQGHMCFPSHVVFIKNFSPRLEMYE